MKREDIIEQCDNFISKLEDENTIRLEERGISARYTTFGHSVGVRALVELIDTLTEEQKESTLKIIKSRKINK